MTVEQVEGLVTVTSLYRDSIMLVRKALALQRQGFGDMPVESPMAEYIAKNDARSKNALAVLDMGFDPDRLEEILHGKPYRLPDSGGLFLGVGYTFTYGLHARECEVDIILNVIPHERIFSVQGRMRSDWKTVFLLEGIILESVVYRESNFYRTPREQDVPYAIFSGSLRGIPVLVVMSKHEVRIHSDEPDSRFIFYSTKLDPVEKT